jgi:hypothetical protein
LKRLRSKRINRLAVVLLRRLTANRTMTWWRSSSQFTQRWCFSQRQSRTRLPPDLARDNALAMPGPPSNVTFARNLPLSDHFWGLGWFDRRPGVRINFVQLNVC